MATERLAPSAFVGTPVNLSGPVTNIDEDPDTPDSLWLTAVDTTASTEVVVAFPTASGPLSGTQNCRIQLRKVGGANNPTARIEVRRSGVLIASFADSAVSTTTVRQVFWTGVDPDGIEVAVISTASGGSPSKRATVEVGAIEWNVTYDVPSIDRAGAITWAELEAPTAPRAASVTWAEIEVGTAPRAAGVTWAELEVPNIPDSSAAVTWAEVEVPTAPRQAEVTWAEFEAPDFIPGSSADITWAEVEVPTAPRAGAVTWAEVELPPAPRAAVVAWSEVEVPLAPRGAWLGWAELEVPAIGGGQPPSIHCKRGTLALMGVGG